MTEKRNVVRRLLIVFVLLAIVTGAKAWRNRPTRFTQAVDTEPTEPGRCRLKTSNRTAWSAHSQSVSLNPGSISRTRVYDRYRFEVRIQLSDPHVSTLLTRFRIPRSIPPRAIGGDS